MNYALYTLLFISAALVSGTLWSLREAIYARARGWVHSFDTDCDYPPRRVLFDVGMFATVGLCLLLILGAWSYALLVLPVSILVPHIRRHVLLTRYQAALNAQIPDFCEFLAAAVRAGVGVRSALDELQAQVGQPLSRELGKIRNEQRLGASVAQSFERWSIRSCSPALSDVSFCIRISQESGGGLGESLINTARALRQARLVQEKARALSAQGRLQAIIMMAIPPLLLVVVSSIDSSTHDFFFNSRAGGALLLVVILLEIVGFRWIQSIVKVE